MVGSMTTQAAVRAPQLAARGAYASRLAHRCGRRCGCAPGAVRCELRRSSGCAGLRRALAPPPPPPRAAWPTTRRLVRPRQPAARLSADAAAGAGAAVAPPTTRVTRNTNMGALQAGYLGPEARLPPSPPPCAAAVGLAGPRALTPLLSADCKASACTPGEEPLRAHHLPRHWRHHGAHPGADRGCYGEGARKVVIELSLADSGPLRLLAAWAR